MNMMGIGLDLMAVMVTFVIIVGILLGEKNTLNELFPTMLLMNALILLSDILLLTYWGESTKIVWIQLCCILQIALVYVNISIFNVYVDKLLVIKIGKNQKIRVVPFIITLIMVILCYLSLEFRFFFYVDATGVVRDGGWSWMVWLVAYFIGLFDFFRVMLHHIKKTLDKNIALGIYIFIAIPMIAIPIAEWMEVRSMVFIAMTLSMLTLYMSIHVKREKDALRRAIESEKMQTERILSQLQPQFIFNSLTTIRYLCTTNEILATEALSKFSKYLRTNLDVVSDSRLIKFREELEHTKTYLWIEQLRFGNKIRVEYSIDVDDFFVPPLSLQPIVENAVKRGVTQKNGLLISITVRENDSCYRIIVRDDGLELENEEKTSDKVRYIGINDVRQRLSQIKGSTIKVTTDLGVGTSVVYEIMKDGLNG